jgi:hypothetical protein
MPGCQQRNESPKGDQIAYVRDGANIALKVCLEVRSKPQGTRLGARQYLWKSAEKEMYFARLRKAERQELKDCGTAGHRLRNAVHQRSLL